MACYLHYTTTNNTEGKLYFTDILCSSVLTDQYLPYTGGYTIKHVGTPFTAIFRNQNVGFKITFDNGATIEITSIRNNPPMKFYNPDGTTFESILTEIYIKMVNKAHPSASTGLTYINNLALTPSCDFERTFCRNLVDLHAEPIYGIATPRPSVNSPGNKGGPYYQVYIDDYYSKQYREGNDSTISLEFFNPSKTYLYLGNDFEQYLIYDGEYPETDTSTAGGGFGNGDNSSDEISAPNLPTGAALAMCKLYNPTSENISGLASFLWSNDFSDVVLKTIYNPIDCIIALYSAPVAPPSVAIENNVKIGGVVSDLAIPRLSMQYTTVNCGNLFISEYWATALDYAPYTKIEIYLPFIGYKTLDIHDVMNSELNVTYNIDLLTGVAVCFIRTIRDGLSSVLYSFPCSIFSAMPLTGGNWNNLVSGLLGLTASAAATVATGGASAPVLATAGAAMNVATSRYSVERSGNLGCNYGALGILTPYIIINRPIQSLAANFNDFNGYPSNITSKLSAITGYTEIDDIHLENMGAQITSAEVDEIETLLKQGVIL